MTTAPQTAPQPADQKMRITGPVPEIYIDGYQGASYKDGVIKLNAYSLTLDPVDNQTYRDVVCRLTLSVSNVISVHAALGNLVRDLEKAGILKLTP